METEAMAAFTTKLTWDLFFLLTNNAIDKEKKAMINNKAVTKPK